MKTRSIVTEIGLSSSSMIALRTESTLTPALRKSMFAMFACCPSVVARRFRWIATIVLWLCGIPFSHGVYATEPPLSWSGPGVVLLKNGNVVAGKLISPREKFVAVRVDDTAQFQLPLDQVVYIAADVQALYRYQVANTRKWEVGEHFQLAKWCLRNGLMDEAYGHYIEVKKHSADHSKFKRFESEMREALLHDPVMQAALKTAFPTPINQASNAVSIESKASGKSVGEEPNEATDEITIKLPQEHQDYFRRQIQPFLVMRCGQAG